ncbi:MAG: domain S-box protein [Ramlibacter sp.]|jgi:PAS domain S-box-containing protein|nr:domain S-box protein [Ramlibacter sp.]
MKRNGASRCAPLVEPGSRVKENPSEVLHRLRNAEALLRMAAKVGRLGAWSFDLETETLTWSEEIRAIHEVARDFRCTAPRALEFYAPGSRPAVWAAFEACIKHGTSYDLEAQIVTARNRTVWVRAIGHAERDMGGAIVKVQGALQDISTGREAAENNRMLAERLTMTLESMAHAFFTIDRQWRFTYMNSEAARLLCCDREALIGKVLWDEFPESIGSDFHLQYEHALATGVAVEMQTFYAPQQIWVQLRAYPSPQGLAVSFRDVSDMVRSREAILRLNSELEERVRARTAELQAANRELESFSYSVAHDLRSPLAALNCFGQMLESSEADAISAQGKHFLDRMRCAASQMDSMTRGLLELASLSKARVRQEAVNLGSIAHQVIGDLVAQSPERATQIVVEPGLLVTGDEVLLTQLLSNLIGNAWKFTARSAVTRVEVGCIRGADHPVYFVRDNGAGFDLTHAARLFEPFHRLHSASEYEGTGIGLATVQRIVSRHAGRVWAEAAPGEGASFFFTLHSEGVAGAAEAADHQTRQA